ncbi:unnamed protein product [Closterium sp. Yama58-4]|nr:unnamed protein product [Closterium sp. Yama58-4]
MKDYLSDCERKRRDHADHAETMAKHFKPRASPSPLPVFPILIPAPLTSPPQLTLPPPVFPTPPSSPILQMSLSQLSLDRAAEILKTGDADASDAVFKLSGAATMADNCQGAFDFEDVAVPASLSGSDQRTSEGGPRGSTVESPPVNGQDGAVASDSRLLAESGPSVMGGVEGEVRRRRRRVQEGGVGERGGEEGGVGERGGEEGGVDDGGDVEKEEGGEEDVGGVEGEQMAGGEGGEGENEMEGEERGEVTGETGVEQGEVEGEIVGDEEYTSPQDPYSDIDPYLGPSGSSDVSEGVEEPISDVDDPTADVDSPTASTEPAETEGQKRTPSSPSSLSSSSSLLQANGTADPPTAPPSSPPPNPPPSPKKPPTLPPDCPKPVVRPPPILPPFSIPRLMPNLVVAQDGSGDFTTIQDALLAAPKKPKGRFVILVMPGVYNERFEVGKPNITLMGLSPALTVITGNASVGTNYTTFNSATVAIDGDYFAAVNIRFENTAGKINNQAVALRVSADQCAFHNCEFWGFQDTLYTHSGRQYYRNCFITGNVDFIFGNAAALFDNCTIQIRQHTSGAPVSASSRQTPTDPTGLVIMNSRVVGETTRCVTGFLGRPWKSYARAAVINSYLSPQISSLGWMDWNGQVNDTTSFIEFNNTGPGANGPRVPWLRPGILANVTAVSDFLPERFLYPFGVIRALLPWL